MKNNVRDAYAKQSKETWEIDGIDFFYGNPILSITENVGRQELFYLQCLLLRPHL